MAPILQCCISFRLVARLSWLFYVGFSLSRCKYIFIYMLTIPDCSYTFTQLSWISISTFAVHQALGRTLQLNQVGQTLEAAIEAAANAVIDLRDSLNEWDSKAGDGDCGSTVSPIFPFLLCTYLLLSGSRYAKLCILLCFFRCTKELLQY